MELMVLDQGTQIDLDAIVCKSVEKLSQRHVRGCNYNPWLVFAAVVSPTWGWQHACLRRRRGSNRSFSSLACRLRLAAGLPSSCSILAMDKWWRFRMPLAL